MSSPSNEPFDDQARGLLHAIQQWTQRNLPAPESGHAGPECQWCPLCQLASMLRGENPEVAERLVEAGAALAAAARALIADPPEPRRPKPAPGRVQPIRLDED